MNLRRQTATTVLAALAALSVAPVASYAATATTTKTVNTATTTKTASAKVNANTATSAQLTAAFTKVGVQNASRWAREVREYRPYKSDPNWAKLRQELSKYHIAQDQLTKLLSVLTV